MNFQQYQQHRIGKLEQQVACQQRLINYYRLALSYARRPRRSYRAKGRQPYGALDPFIWLAWLLNKGLDRFARLLEWSFGVGFATLEWMGAKLLRILERNLPQWWATLKTAMKEVSLN